MPNTVTPKSKTSRTETANACHPIRVLLLSAADSGTTASLIESIPLVQLSQCSSLPEALPVLNDQPFDVVILALKAAADPVSIVSELHSAYSGLPIIVLASGAEEDAALHLLRCGASDYLLTDNVQLDTVARVLRYALSLSRLQRRVHDLNRNLEVANHRLRELFLPAIEKGSQLLRQ